VIFLGRAVVLLVPSNVCRRGRCEQIEKNNNLSQRPYRRMLLRKKLINKMIDKGLKYDFPKHNPDPFDENFNGNYFVSANGFSNLSDNLKDFSLIECGKYIPMGYKTLLICQRVALIRGGQIIKAWSSSEKIKTQADPFNGKYLLQTNTKNKIFIPDWNRDIETETIRKPFARDASLKSMLWDNKTSCINQGIETSCQTQSDCLVSILIENVYWH
jgi:hypothetical protein